MWRSIADAETERRVWEAVDELARCLGAYIEEQVPDPERTQDPSLGGGTVGAALFFAYLDAARSDIDAADAGDPIDAGDRAVEALGTSIEILGNRRTIPPWLYMGFSGVGWVVEHLTREMIEGDDELCDPIDDALAELLARPPESHPYELIRGLAGVGLYLLERLPHPNARELLPRVIDGLEATAERSAAGCAWFTPPDLNMPSKRDAFPDGCYNLGVAHGIPGVLGFLTEARREGLDDPRLDRLAEGTVRWLLDQRLPEGDDSAFPPFAAVGMTPAGTRTAWCYGDLGIAPVLLAAGRTFGHPDWEREALRVARLAARRPEAQAGVVDASLCHGTAGNGHLFLRLHQATGDPLLAEAARSHLERTLAFHRPGEPMAGFETWMTGWPHDDGAWCAEPGFLMGAAGVGLALLATVSEVEPGWDRVMLASVAPRPTDETADTADTADRPAEAVEDAAVAAGAVPGASVGDAR